MQLCLIESSQLLGLHNRKQPWNPYADKTSEKDKTPKDSTTTGDLIIPKNNHEFQKHWRKYQKDKVKKYQYLIHVGGLTLAEIFKAEISMGLLGEIVEILNENWNNVDFSKIFCILHSLSTVKRFELSLQFLSSKEKQALGELFTKLNEVTLDGVEWGLGEQHLDVDLKTLKEHYGVAELN